MALPKYMGNDCELSTSGVDARDQAIPSWDVTRAVLDHIDAAFEPYGTRTWSRARVWSDSQGSAYGASAWSSDCLRHWSPVGGCVYSDMGHIEVCTPAALQPRAYAAHCFAVLRVVEAARQRAEAASEAGEQHAAYAAGGARYALSTANVDVLDPAVSWGTHVNVSIDSRLWEDLFVEHRRPAMLGFVASAMAAAVPFFGAGYLMPMRDGDVVYSLSARAHHLTQVITSATTEAFRRGLLNDRREPHAQGQERLHLIGFDFALASAVLRCSFLQCVLAAAEEGFCDLIAYEPVRALHAWSWGLERTTGRLTGAATLIDGRKLTLPGYVRELTSKLLAMCEQGLIPETVAPGARELLPIVLELAERAARGDLLHCAKHLDWAAKFLGLTDMCSAPGVRLGDAATRLFDHDFARTERARGPFWSLWEQGLVDPLVGADEIEACLRDGPPESRDWSRGRLIQAFHGDITDVDWSFVELRRDADRWQSRLRVEFPRPDSRPRASFEPLLARARSVAELGELLRGDDEGTAETDPILDIRSEVASQSVAASHQPRATGSHPN